MIVKILMKQHYLKKKEFYSNLNMEDITAEITCMQKGFTKNLK